MVDELHALEANQTQDLVSHPNDVSVISSKWVYIVKIKHDGTLDRQKARPVTQGYKQEYGMNNNAQKP